jgi:hypothetical protein
LRALKKTVTRHRACEVPGCVTLIAVIDPVVAVASKSTLPVQLLLKTIGDELTPVEESIRAVPLPRSAV